MNSETQTVQSRYILPAKLLANANPKLAGSNINVLPFLLGEMYNKENKISNSPEKIQYSIYKPESEDQVRIS